MLVPQLQPHHGLLLARFLCPQDSPSKNTGEGCHFLLQAIFLTLGLNPGLLHCREILYCLGHQGTLNILNKCFLEKFFSLNFNIEMCRLEPVMTQENLANTFQFYFLFCNLSFFPLRTKIKRSHNLDSTMHRCVKYM